MNRLSILLSRGFLSLALLFCLCIVLIMPACAGTFGDQIKDFYQSKKMPSVTLSTEEDASPEVFTQLKIPVLLSILKYELSSGSWPDLSSSDRSGLISILDDPDLKMIYTGKQSSLAVSAGGQAIDDKTIKFSQDGWYLSGSPRSHYDIAKTILHEIGHAYQLRNNWLPRPGTTKEWFPEELEKQLSSEHFSSEAVDEAAKVLGGEDIAGSWSGELIVSNVEGDSPINIGQKRSVTGDGFVISQEGNDIKLKFQNNEISGKMDGGKADLTSNPTGTVSEAILTPSQGKLGVILKQMSSTGAVITSEGLLSR